MNPLILATLSSALPGTLPPQFVDAGMMKVDHCTNKVVAGVVSLGGEANTAGILEAEVTVMLEHVMPGPVPHMLSQNLLVSIITMFVSCSRF